MNTLETAFDEMVSLTDQVLEPRDGVAPAAALYRIIAFLDPETYQPVVTSFAQEALRKIAERFEEPAPIIRFDAPLRIEAGVHKTFRLFFLSSLEFALKVAHEIVACMNVSLMDHYPRVNLYTLLRPSAESQGVLYDIRNQWNMNSFLIRDELDKAYAFLISNREQYTGTHAQPLETVMYQRMVYSRRALGDYLLVISILNSIAQNAAKIKAMMAASNHRVSPFLRFGFQVTGQNGHWLRVEGSKEALLAGVGDWMERHQEWRQVVRTTWESIRLARGTALDADLFPPTYNT